MREEAHNKRAMRAAAPVNDLSDAQWQEICQAYKYRCVYCNKKKTFKTLTQDHVTPYKHKGSHTVWNVVPACHACNSAKKTGPPPVSVQPLLLTLAPKRKRRKRSDS